MTGLPLYSGREATIDTIHQATAIYTVPEEISALLDRLDWPAVGGRLLDPGAGNGGVLIAALDRLRLAHDDVATAVFSVKGYEFHAGAVAAARRRVADHLLGRCWSGIAAGAAASQIVEERDFLLSPVPVATFSVIAANPPYWRALNLPAEYRADYEAMVAPHAQADLLYAYLQRAADIVAPNGSIGLVTSDRWLLNASSAELRRRLGKRFSVRDLRRLDSASAFYRPKTRTRGTPARVHPVSLVLDPAGVGAALTAAPFPLDGLPEAEGVLLGDLAEIRLAPWLGPEGIFVVRDPAALPGAVLVPVVEPDDIDPRGDCLTGSSRWAIVTRADVEPGPSVLAHLDGQLHRMPPRGRRATRWVPPETFIGRLPLDVDAVMVPRIAKRLRAIPLPAGTMPINHNLVVVSGHPVAAMVAWLNHPAVQAQADALSLRLENGYASFTATLLRQLRIPAELIACEAYGQAAGDPGIEKTARRRGPAGFAKGAAE
ncbi:MAG: N-6 DNA methylase [Caulobacterales bacterium]|nr:N-6 DNA methylase [Caulobacterales bacterium]